jgi:uncharacterized protein (DUF1330 family)
VPKAYLIAHIRAHNIEKMKEFGSLARPAIAKFGGTVLVTSLTPTIKEGPDSGIAVLVEFGNLDAANLFYHSEDYTAAKAIRLLAAETDLIIVEGL